MWEVKWKHKFLDSYKSQTSPSSRPRGDFLSIFCHLVGLRRIFTLLINDLRCQSFPCGPHWLASKWDRARGSASSSAGAGLREPADLHGAALSLSECVCGQDVQLQICYLVTVRGKDQSMWGLLLLSVHFGGCPRCHLGKICTNFTSVFSREFEKLSVGLDTSPLPVTLADPSSGYVGGLGHSSEHRERSQ